MGWYGENNNNKCVVTLQIISIYQALLHELTMYFIHKARECQMTVSEDLFSLTFANCKFVGWVIHCVDCTVGTLLVKHALNYAESLSGEGQRTCFRFSFSVFLISSSVVCFFSPSPVFALCIHFSLFSPHADGAHGLCVAFCTERRGGAHGLCVAFCTERRGGAHDLCVAFCTERRGGAHGLCVAFCTERWGTRSVCSILH